VDPGPVYMLLEKRLFSCPGEIRNADRSAHSVVSIPSPHAVKSSRGDASEEFRLLDCDAVLSCRIRQMFRKLFQNVVHTIYQNMRLYVKIQSLHRPLIGP